MIQELSEQNSQVVFQQPVALLWFTASWCVPCRQIAPLIEKIAKGIPNLSIYRVDIDRLGGLAAQFSVQSVPCFVSLVHGRVFDQFVGTNPQAILAMIGRLPG